MRCHSRGGTHRAERQSVAGGPRRGVAGVARMRGDGAGPERLHDFLDLLHFFFCILPDSVQEIEEVVEALEQSGVRSVMVEGGARTIGMFLGEDAVDSLRLAVSPATVDDVRAPRFPDFGRLPFEGRAAKAIRRVGDMEVYEYAFRAAPDGLTLTDRRRLLRAVELGECSPPCGTAYRVGCVVATLDGREYEGYTHETDPRNHAEEEALEKAAAAGADLRGAAIYTSMEPCSVRASKPVSCTERIVRSGAARVVYAYAEPECFVRCEGTRLLREAGVEVLPVPAYAPLVRRTNGHIVHD